MSKLRVFSDKHMNLFQILIQQQDWEKKTHAYNSLSTQAEEYYLHKCIHKGVQIPPNIQQSFRRLTRGHKGGFFLPILNLRAFLNPLARDS